MTLNNAHDLFEIKLQAVLASERRILDVLEEAASEATEPKLREAFEHHRKETEEQVKRVEQVFTSLGKKPRNVDASVVEGLIEEKRRFLSEDPIPEVLDMFNVSAGVKTEHMEIAAYEDLLILAEQIGANDIVAPLRKNLEEEKATLEKLTGFAKQGTIPRERPTQTQGQTSSR
jgi:ferritin-like metal-binding protein YciE